MTNTFTFYLLWAFIQHSLIIATCWFLPIDVVYRVITSIILFTLCHFPNWQLMIITCLGAIVTYITFGTLFIQESWYALFVMPLFIVAHAFLGRYLIKRGLEMRVLWLHPTWKSWFNKT